MLLDYLRTHRLAVVSSLSAGGAPQSALLGVAVTTRAWPHIAYWRITPVWIRYSDYARGPPDHGEALLIAHRGE
jgi:hypothetical protein